MFEYAGSKLKTFANILFWISVVGSIILAISLGWEEEYHSGYFGGYTDKVFRPVYFFSFLIIGPLFSYVECLLLYAFGDLLDTASSIDSHQKDIIRILGSDKQETEKTRTPSSQNNSLNTGTSRPQVSRPTSASSDT